MSNIQFKGCNLVGGSTAYTTWGAAGPVSGTNYQFVSPADVDYHMSKGQNTFRLVFAWEALQPTPYATLSTTSGNYAIYRDKLYALVDYITGKGANVILDIHNDIDALFAAYRGVPVGQANAAGQKTEDLLANVWRQLATKYAANPHVWYGVTNEPHGIAPAVWFAAAQKVVTAIRTAGATAPIIMPGTAWTGAGTWVSSGNAAAWNLVDPANNLHVQLHLYFDTDASGLTNGIVSTTIGRDRLKDAVAWARGRGLKVFLGEVALSATNVFAASTWANLVAFMEANSDVVLGWCWWAAGDAAWWGTYQFDLGKNSAGAESAQMALVAPSFLVTAPVPAPVDPTVALQAQIDSLKAQVASLTAQASSLQTSLTSAAAQTAALRRAIVDSINALTVVL